MKQKFWNYNHTLYACFMSYAVQAIVNTFAPLLFLTFEHTYGISSAKITLLVTINFCVQLAIDTVSIKLLDKISYRTAMILAHFMAACGLICLTVLPEIFPDSYIGLVTATTIYAIGGGLLEVVASPLVESCPTENKEAAMSLSHSFYCWGQVVVIIISTLFFNIFGIHNWKILSIIWAILPICTLLLFTKVPIANLLADEEEGLSLKQLASMKIFWLFILIMIASGACEQALCQWASVFAEQELKIAKTIGDLAGPMSFALTMGITRTFYGKFGHKIPLAPCMYVSGFLCLASYLIISLCPISTIALLGFGLCGISVGLLWPGTYSLASGAIPTGGTAMFALLALAGDIGCSSGPTLVGLVSDDLKTGLLFVTIFPIILIVSLFLIRKHNKRQA